MKPAPTKKKYVAPAIVYEGRISTRAGSTRSSSESAPVDLFDSSKGD